MNEWMNYASLIAEQRRKERVEMYDEVDAIRAKFGFKIENFSDGPTELDRQFLWANWITWEGDNRG
jgi:hypothetical protein